MYVFRTDQLVLFHGKDDFAQTTFLVACSFVVYKCILLGFPICLGISIAVLVQIILGSHVGETLGM